MPMAAQVADYGGKPPMKGMRYKFALLLSLLQRLNGGGLMVMAVRAGE